MGADLQRTGTAVSLVGWLCRRNQLGPRRSTSCSCYQWKHSRKIPSCRLPFKEGKGGVLPCLYDRVIGSSFYPYLLYSLLIKHTVRGFPGPTLIARQSTDCTAEGDRPEADGKERCGGELSVSGSNSRHKKKKTMLKILDGRDQTLLKRGSPKNDIARLGPC